MRRFEDGLEKLYEVETKRINEAVKNNPDKFPERFSWKLTNEDESVDIYVDYGLEMNYQFLSNCKIHISVCSKGCETFSLHK